MPRAGVLPRGQKGPHSNLLPAAELEELRFRIAQVVVCSRAELLCFGRTGFRAQHTQQALALAAAMGNRPLECPMNAPNVLKLLAIDDNPENLALIAASLESESLEILTENDPEVGFETFLRLRPRIVLLDLVMPKVSGMELLERIVAVDPGVDVILITAHYSTESAVEAIQKGACDY